MGKKPTDFEGYMEVLERKLAVDESCKESICREIRQNLQDKYSELLIKGYGLEQGLVETISSFEEPEKLAYMFNELYGQDKLKVFAARNKTLLAVLSAAIIMTLLV